MKEKIDKERRRDKEIISSIFASPFIFNGLDHISALPLNLLGWSIQTASGVIFIDKKGKWWFQEPGCGIAVYHDKKEAQKIAQKIRRQMPELIGWTKIVPVYGCEYPEQKKGE
jgi:hypothetical protein